MSRQPPPPIKLPIHNPAPAAACPSSRYLWDDEIELVRAMHEIKMQVRSARRHGDLARIDELRARFQELDARREKIRRERLDSQGLFDYD